MFELESDVWEDKGIGFDLPPDQFQRAGRLRMCQAPYGQLENNTEYKWGSRGAANQSYTVECISHADGGTSGLSVPAYGRSEK